MLPDDWTTRLGFATGASTPSGAAALAGAGDFYIETGFAWNLVRFALPGEPTETPTRGSINLELSTSWNNDPDLLDIHQRGFMGLSTVFGFPMGKTTIGDPPVPIGELMVRIGAARVEVPQFLNSQSDEVLVANDVPEFEGGWGVGLDAEFNLPLGGKLGYLTLRGTMNSGFDPNPWTATVGYTVPLSFLRGILAGGDSGSSE